MEFDKNMIAVKVIDKCTNWLLIGFYGPLYQAKKRKDWGNLFALLESHQAHRRVLVILTSSLMRRNKLVATEVDLQEKTISKN